VRRREFIALLGGAVIARSPLAAAQPSEKIFRIAVFATMTPVPNVAGLDPINPPLRAFARTMRDLGYVEGRNLILERWAQQTSVGRYSVIATDLVRRKTDMIVTVGNAMVLEMKSVTNAVPIVMATSSDPVQAGIVASLARPGGNITGFTSDTGPEFEVKRLQLLKEALPEAARVAYLGLKSDWESLEGRSIRAGASTLGVTLGHAEQSTTNYFAAFDSITRERPHALFVAANTMNYANRQTIAEFAVEQQMPGVCPFREFVEAGGLMSYGVNLDDLFSRAAGYVDKILKGAKPADLPVQQPTKFELVINVRTARALGLTIPPTLLAQVDEVIE
jgi:putative ABC transport system substrate-binding protein